VVFSNVFYTGGEVNSCPVEPVIRGPHNPKTLLADLPHRTLARSLQHRHHPRSGLVIPAEFPKEVGVR